MPKTTMATWTIRMFSAVILQWKQNALNLTKVAIGLLTRAQHAIPAGKSPFRISSLIMSVRRFLVIHLRGRAGVRACRSTVNNVKYTPGVGVSRTTIQETLKNRHTQAAFSTCVSLGKAIGFFISTMKTLLALLIPIVNDADIKRSSRFAIVLLLQIKRAHPNRMIRGRRLWAIFRLDGLGGGSNLCNRGRYNR